LLALIFWNARRSDADQTQYRDALFGFHEELNDNKPAGFRFSCTFASPPTPWFNAGSEIYEDWYVLRNFAGIDALEEAVANRDTMQSHRFLMRHTAGASAAIVGLSGGQARIFDFTEAYWTSTRQAIAIDGFFAANLAGGSSRVNMSVWTRSLALGPNERLILAKASIPEDVARGAVHLQRQLEWRPE